MRHGERAARSQLPRELPNRRVRVGPVDRRADGDEIDGAGAHGGVFGFFLQEAELRGGELGVDAEEAAGQGYVAVVGVGDDGVGEFGGEGGGDDAAAAADVVGLVIAGVGFGGVVGEDLGVEGGGVERAVFEV